ncbi:phosphorylase [filamentous cyanobacterium CCP5]|nr:phosphorylase [filamentous cyanobacterium CCP5]
MTARDSDLLLEPGTLEKKVIAQTHHGLNCGALQPIATEFDFIEDQGMRFLVRILANLERKQKATKAQKQKDPDFNPFLPYEADLFVTDISRTHLCLLNKYNVVENHILIVTREFEEQDSWLNYADLEALWACMAEIDGLGFYNGGTRAGASQRHKHLQLTPLPMAPDRSALPLEAFLSDLPPGAVSNTTGLPFHHAAIALPPRFETTAADWLTHAYKQLMGAIAIDLMQPQPNQPYNLLLTRRWMLAIPRSQESSQGISVNSLGFAGSLLVKNAAQRQELQQLGPMNLLQAVAYPAI